MNDQSGIYSEYAYSRSHSGFARRVVSFWHHQMFSIYQGYMHTSHSPYIVEIGIGHCYLAKLCQDLNIRYQGFDNSQSLVDIYKEYGYDIHCRSIPPFPKYKECVTVWISHVLEHMASAYEARNFLLSIYQNIEPGSNVVIICPDYRDWNFFFWDCDWSHGYPTTLNRINQLLTDVGFIPSFAKHHRYGSTLPVVRLFALLCNALIFNKFVSFLSRLFTNKDYPASMLSLMGYRQIYLIASKPASIV